MAGGPQIWTEELIAERASHGRGQGEYERYSPWMFVQEFSSRGTQTRIPSVKLRRTIHTFSYLERAAFLLAEFHPEFLDYREQYAMDRGITTSAARALRIRHPRYPKTRNPIVMTLDAVVAMRAPDGTEHLAGLDVKPARLLEKSRVLEKLSLHKAYCAHVGMQHFVFTEQSFSKARVRNIDWIRMSLFKDGELETVEGMFTTHPVSMLKRLAACKRAPIMNQFCTKYDIEHGLPRGTGLRIMKQLLWSRRAFTDMNAERIELALVRAGSPSEVAPFGGRQQ